MAWMHITQRTGAGSRTIMGGIGEVLVQYYGYHRLGHASMECELCDTFAFGWLCRVSEFCSHSRDATLRKPPQAISPQNPHTL